MIEIKKIFYVEDAINDFMDLMYDLIYKEQINIILDLEKDIKINGYENDLIQCFINIFNNARVALSEKNIERKLTYYFWSTGREA